jgi:hypothetical protein
VFGFLEAVGDSGEDADLGVGRLDERVGQVVEQHRFDAGEVLADPAAELDERGDPTSCGPVESLVEHEDRSHALDGDDGSELLFEQVGVVETAVDLGDPGELGLLAGGEVLGVLPQRVAGPL